MRRATVPVSPVTMRAVLKTLAWMLAAAIFLVSLSPGIGWACACGCGVFEVGTSSLFPESPGGTVYFEYNFMDQYLNWHATQIASAAANPDKIIRTNFFTLGAQYMFNHQWGVMAQIPYWERTFKTTGDAGAIEKFTHSALGDVRISGMYTGFSEDMSTGLTLGLKLPSGDYTYRNFDRDSSIGTGSTDALIGAYHLGVMPLTWRDRPFNWFAQGNWDLPFWTRDHYNPGRELDLALGTYYNFGALGFLKEVAPVVQLIGSDRERDHGSAANPDNSGYDRLLISVGGETKINILRLYADAELPVFQNIVGNQLTAPVLFKTILSYDF